ncbi:MAG: [Fe-Fe] hydrogenase large subunit C-terminal domain-containing protein, partial [Spirochaetota bacterium]
GDEIGVVFVSPCIAKKKEADDYPGLIDVAITFDDLRAWFDQAQLSISYLDDSGAAFLPHRASRGSSFPVEGGFVANLAASAGGVPSVNTVSVSGIDEVRAVLDELDADQAAGCHGEPVILELLACAGGCINGPRHSRRSGRLGRTAGVRRWARSVGPPAGGSPPRPAIAHAPDVRASAAVSAAVTRRLHEESEIRAALAAVGKHQKSDELNCGSCGYASCRDFAAALIEDRAERTMCMGHMRKVAQKKSDALLRAMPSGVVVVDANLAIRECNAQFARLAGEEPSLLYEAKPGLEGIDLRDIVSFSRTFEQVFATGADVVGEDFTQDGRVLSGSVFTIEAGTLVGGVFQDVTVPAVQRDRVISRAEEVIRRNLSTVQQIAHLMGENAAETEALLNSVIVAFGPGSTSTS